MTPARDKLAQVSAYQCRIIHDKELHSVTYHLNSFSLADVLGDLKIESLTCYCICVITCYRDRKY